MRLVISSVFLFVLTCSDTASNEDPRQDLLQGWGNNLILARYNTFHQQTLKLQTEVESLCDEVSEQNLRNAQQAWWVARGTWKQAEVFAFGPYQDLPWRLGPKIDFWPVRTDSVDELLDTELTDERIAATTSTERGLPVIEYLLYRQEALPSLEDANTCIYLQGISALLVDDSLAMFEAWDPAHDNYLGQLLDPDNAEDSMFESLHMAFGEIINRMGFTLENIQRDKLGKPLGTTESEASLDSVESRFSARAIEDIRDNIDTIYKLYFGDEENAVPSLSAYLHLRGRDFDERAMEFFDNCLLALEQLEPSLRESLVDDPSAVQNAIDEIGLLKHFLQTEVMNALGITQTFNDADGD